MLRRAAQHGRNIAKLTIQPRAAVVVPYAGRCHPSPRNPAAVARRTTHSQRVTDRPSSAPARSRPRNQDSAGADPIRWTGWLSRSTFGVKL